jgi:hypothetical protein
MKISRFPQGTSVRVRQGPLPMDASLVGRTGLVVGHDRAVLRKVTVQLDGEERLRVFTDDELVEA